MKVLLVPKLQQGKNSMMINREIFVHASCTEKLSLLESGQVLLRFVFGIIYLLNRPTQLAHEIHSLRFRNKDMFLSRRWRSYA